MLWLILSEVSFSQLTSLFLDHGEADHHGREHVGKKKWLMADRRQREGGSRGVRNQRKAPFNGMPSVILFQPGPNFLSFHTFQ